MDIHLLINFQVNQLGRRVVDYIPKAKYVHLEENLKSVYMELQNGRHNRIDVGIYSFKKEQDTA